MLYISGSKDTLKDLKEQEGFEGSFSDYIKQFAKLNPELCKQNPNYNQQLPSYMPMYLVTQPPFDPIHASVTVREVSQFNLDERKKIRLMQDQNHDIPTHMATVDILEEFRAYASGAKKNLNSPIFQTESKTFNSSFKQKSLIKMTGESINYGVKLAQESDRFVKMNNLYEYMKKRDELNHELLKLKGQKGTAAAGARRTLESQTKELTSKIKKLLPKKINEAANKYVLPSVDPKEATKLRANSTSVKLAKKGIDKIKATHIDRLTKTGLGRYRSMLGEFKMIGNGVKKFATYTNYALTAYEIQETYENGGDVARTAFREGSAIYASMLISAMAGGSLTGLGGIVIGTLAGDVTLGATILVCYPVIGWVVLIVAGAAVAGYCTYQTKELSDKIYDASTSDYVKNKIYEFAGWIFDEFKFLGQQILKNDT